MTLPTMGAPVAHPVRLPRTPERPTAVRVPTVAQAVGVMAFALVYIAIAVAGVLGIAFLFGVQGSTFELVTSVGIVANGAALFAVWLHLIRRRGYRWVDLGLGRPSWRILHVLWQAPVLMVAAAVFTGVTLQLVFGGNPPTAGSTALAAALGMPPLLILLAWVVVAVVTPFVEEIIFRGILFRSLDGRMHAVWAVLLGGLVFGAAHVIPAALPYVTALGIGLCLVTLFHRNIWASILIHSFNNSVVFLLILVGVKSAA